MEIDEKNYMEQLKKGNEEALLYIIEEYGWVIKTIVTRHMADLVSYQEDCINDIFWDIWKNAKRYHPKQGTFQNWISGIARFKCIDYRRKYSSDLKNKTIEDIELIGDGEVNIPFLDKELEKEIEELLECLTKTERELFIKLYVEEMDVTEVSEKTGIKKENIYNHLSRGRKKMRKCLEGQANHLSNRRKQNGF